MNASAVRPAFGGADVTRKLMRRWNNAKPALLYLEPGWLSNGWLHVKLLCVIGLTVVHHLLARWQRDLAAGRDRHSPRFYRVVNEVPTVLMIIIVIMVIVKPF